MNEMIVAKGRLIELVHLHQDDGRIFEIARRAGMHAIEYKGFASFQESLKQLLQTGGE